MIINLYLKKYAYLDLGMISDGEDLRQHYVSLVRLLVDNKEFVEMLDMIESGIVCYAVYEDVKLLK